MLGLQSAPPAVPASTVAQANTYPSACLVQVQGGTVTVVAIGATTIGITNGLVILPAGETITLTYSVAPTWRWYAIGLP